jgi:oligopeptidase B
LEFGSGKDTIFYTEVDETNRPFAVKMMNYKTMKETTVFTDNDPTHYIDIGSTKDGKYIVISSNTKEDSEVWVINREITNESITPTKIITRKEGIKAHIDHLRDFFIMITNYGVKSKNYKLTTLKDEEFELKKESLT